MNVAGRGTCCFPLPGVSGTIWCELFTVSLLRSDPNWTLLVGDYFVKSWHHWEGGFIECVFTLLELPY